MLTTNEKILALRHRHGMSQEGVAKKLGMSRQSYNKREHDERLWSLEELRKMSELFGVSLSELLNDTVQ